MKRHSRLWSAAGRWTRLLEGEQGSTAAEYALFLALVVGATLLGSEFLGFAVRQTFAAAADQLAAAPNAQSGAVAVRAKNSPSRNVEPPVIPNENAAIWIEYGVLGAGLLGGAVLWAVLYSRRKKPQTHPKTEPSHEPRVEVDTAAVFRKRQEILRLISGDMEHLLRGEIQVEQIMSRRLTTVTPETPLAQIQHLVQDGKLRHLLVVDKRGRLRGVISDRDLKKKSARTAADLMTADPHTVRPDSPLNPAVTMLINHRISCLPVVDGEQAVGVLTSTDLLLALQCTLQALHKIASEIHRESCDESSSGALSANSR